MSTYTSIQDRLRNTLRDAMSAVGCLGASRSGVESANHRLSIKAAEDRFETILKGIPAWLPIDTAPKDGTTILLWDPVADEKLVIGCWVVSRWTDYEWTYHPTYWMPLPEGPTP